MLEHAGEPARHDMRTAEIGFGECRDNRTVLLAAGEVDVADEPAEQAGSIDAGAAADAVEGEARDRQCAAAILRLMHRALEVAPERGAREKAGFRVKRPVAV